MRETLTKGIAMSSGVENIKLGACDVTFGDVSLGLTKGGVEVEVTTDTHEVKVDQFGETTVSERIMGRNIKVKVPMVETDIAKITAVMPGSTIDAGQKTLTVKVGEGIDLVKLAQALVLTPRNKDDYSVTIPRAATAGSMSFAYKHNEERVFELEFTAYPDSTGHLMTVGGSAAEALVKQSTAKTAK